MGRSTSSAISALALAELAEKHAASAAIQPDRVEAAGLKRQNLAHAKLSNLAKAHRQFLEDCSDRQPSLLHAGFHRKRPAAVGTRRLDCFPLELLAERDQKRLRNENETFTGDAAHWQREAGRRARHVAPPKCVDVGQRHEALKCDRQGPELGKGRFERVPEHTSEFFDERGLDRCTRSRRLLLRSVLDLRSKVVAEDGRYNEIVDAFVERDEESCFRLRARIDRRRETTAVCDRLEQCRSPRRLDGCGPAAQPRSGARLRCASATNRSSAKASPGRRSTARPAWSRSASLSLPAPSPPSRASPSTVMLLP